MARAPVNQSQVSIGWSDFLPLAAAAVLMIFALEPLIEWWRLGRLLNHGVSAPAIITSTSIDATGRFSVDVVNYEFTAPDRAAPISGVERFRNGPSPDLDPGELAGKFYKGALNARYLPSNPQAHRLELGLVRRRTRAGWNALMLILGSATIGALGLFRWRRRLAADER